MEPTATLTVRWLHHAALDARLVEAVGGIRLLGLTSWPATVQAPFLDSVARGQPVLPKVDYPGSTSAKSAALAAIAADCDDSHPLGHYVQQSAQSWDPAAQLLEGLGTAAVDTCSVQLFGAPEQPLPGNGPSTRDAARHFIQIAAELDHELLAPEEQVPVSAIALQLCCRTIWMRSSNRASSRCSWIRNSFPRPPPARPASACAPVRASAPTTARSCSTMKRWCTR